jgi:outer membrane protein TolC
MKKGIIFLLLSVCAGSVYAQSLSASGNGNSDVLVIDEQTVETKIYTSFNYRAAMIQHKIDQRDARFWSFLIPTASFTAAQSIGDKAFTNTYGGSPAAGQGKWVSNLNLGADLNVSLSNIINIPIIIDQYQNNELTYEQTRTQIINNAKTTFYTLIASRQQLTVLQSSVNAALSAYNQARASYSSGLVDRVTMLNAQYQYQSMLNTLNTARTGYESGLLQFKQLLGIPLEQTVELQGNIEVLPIQFYGDKMAADYLDEALDVKIEENKKSSAFMTQFLRVSNIINPFVGMSYDWNRTKIGGGSALFTDAAALNLGISVNLSYSLLKDMPSVVEGYALQKEAVVEKRKTVQIDIINYANQLNDLQGAIRIAEQNVLINRESLTLTQTAYRQGLKTFTELQDAITNAQDAEVALLQSKLDYLTALLNLSAVIGIEPSVLLQQAQQYNNSLAAAQAANQ